MRFPPNASRLVVLLLALLLMLLAIPVAAQTPCDSYAGRLADLYSREQLKQFVHCAAAHLDMVGWEQAAIDFGTDAWLDGSLSLFATRADGTVLFSPGSDLNADDNLWDWQDPDGVFPSREQVRITQDFGSGYVYLRYTSSATGQVEPLETYVLLADYQGEAAYIGAALYPQDTHATCSPDVVRATLVYTERDVERFVGCAAHHLQQHGLQALHDFEHDERWNAGPTYLFLIDQQTLYMVANAGQPQLVGTDTTELTDPGGVKLIQEMQRVLASHDDGYVYYSFRNPVTDEEGYKGSYVQRLLIDGRAYILGAGLYIPAAECRALPLARDIDTRDELQQFVRCAAQLVAERGELAWDLFLNHPQWIGGAVYIFVLDDLCRPLIYPIDYQRADSDESRCYVTFAAGFPVNAEINATTRSQVGQGWVDYVWLNPASNEVETRHAFVVWGALNGDRTTGDHISIGAGLYESDMQE